MIPHLQNNEQPSTHVYMYIFYVEFYEHSEKYGKIYSILKRARADHKKGSGKKDCITNNFKMCICSTYAFV